MNGNVGQDLLILVVSIWTLFWKGIALWKAAKQNQKNWFIAILILNTVGILDIVYLFRFSTKRLTIEELKNDVRHFFKSSSLTKKSSK